MGSGRLDDGAKMIMPMGTVYRFEDFEFDPAQRSLRRAGAEITLRHKVFDILLHLILHRDRVVSKDELVERIWNGAAVTDDSLFRSISDIRIALSEDRTSPRWIRTAPKVGYQFIGRVEEVTRVVLKEVVTEAPRYKIEVPAAPPSRSFPKWTLVLGAALAVSAAAYLWLPLRPKPERPYGEVAWWRFDEGAGRRAADSARNGSSSGALVGEAAWIEGVQGKALHFPPGTGGYVEGDDRSGRLPRGSSPRTITAWIRTSTSNGDDTNNLRYGAPRIIGTLNFHLMLLQNGRIAFGYDAANGVIRGRTALLDGSWHFVSGVYEGLPTNMAHLFVDGELDASGKLPLPPLTGDYSKWLLGGPFGSQTAFRGDLDDVRVYSRAVRPAELQALYGCTRRSADVTLPDAKAGYFLPVLDPETGAPHTSLRPHSVVQTGDDFGGVQFSLAAGECLITKLEGVDVGQDLSFAMDVLVPKHGEGLTAAGPYFRSRAAAPGDGIIGGTSAGYWVLLDSSGAVRVWRLNPSEVVAYSTPRSDFATDRFHHLEAAAFGQTLEVSVDGERVSFDQGGRTASSVLIPPKWEEQKPPGKNSGCAGVGFMAIPRHSGGGQEVRGLVVKTYRPSDRP
jgi:DNA-binding winged helix-turn-helix (wHTH) protein